MISKLKGTIRAMAAKLWAGFFQWSRPRLVSGALADLTRNRKDLVVENALLRHQVVVLKRAAKRPKLRGRDRVLTVLLSKLSPTWATALHTVQPETVLRWHRDGFRRLWRRQSRAASNKPKLDRNKILLIRKMATHNRLWGAERIQRELLKIGIRVSKRTIQRYMRSARRPVSGGQSWATFIENHKDDIWACDFLQLYDLRFMSIVAFFIIELGRRKVVHVAVTRSPSEQWVAQQLRNATPDGVGPRCLIRDRDDKFGAAFDRVAKGTGIRVLKTAVRAPNMNAACERFLGSVRRERLDHVIVLGERHLLRLLQEYGMYFNKFRSHQGLGHGTPEGAANIGPAAGGIERAPILGGLHHACRRAA